MVKALAVAWRVFVNHRRLTCIIAVIWQLFFFLFRRYQIVPRCGCNEVTMVYRSILQTVIVSVAWQRITTASWLVYHAERLALCYGMYDQATVAQTDHCTNALVVNRPCGTGTRPHTKRAGARSQCSSSFVQPIRVTLLSGLCISVSVPSSKQLRQIYASGDDARYKLITIDSLNNTFPISYIFQSISMLFLFLLCLANVMSIFRGNDNFFEFSLSG